MTHPILPLAASLLILALAACTAPVAPLVTEVPVAAVEPLPAPSKPTSAPKAPKLTARAAVADTADFEVELRRSGCYGRCPAYRVSLRGDGMVTFVGERDVGSIGEHQAQVSAEAVAALQAQLRSAPFSSLKGRYTPDDPRCGQVVSDMASVSIVISDGGTRQIEHYLGCSNAPASLYTLAQAIDEATGSARWIGAATE